MSKKYKKKMYIKIKPVYISGSSARCKLFQLIVKVKNARYFRARYLNPFYTKHTLYITHIQIKCYFMFCFNQKQNKT